MRFLFRMVFLHLLALALAGPAPAQPPPPAPTGDAPQPWRPENPAAASLPPLGPGPIPAASPDANAAPAPPEPSAEEKLALLSRQICILQGQGRVQGAADPDDKVQKQLDIQRRQIEVLERMVRLLADQLKKAPPAGAAVEKLQEQVATLDARGKQAARRDQEVAHEFDRVNEHIDAEERSGPRLPATLKELFLPTQTNETPLSIYGSLAFGYSHILGNAATAANGAGRPATPGGFYFGEFSPDFFLKLNDWIFMEAEIAVGPGGSVTATFAQADFLVNDWLTITAGKFVAPIGWYNLRINNPWVNRLPADAPGAAPLPWLQVLPPISLLGVQAQGAFYLGCSPFKLEYNAYVSNGLNFTPATARSPTINELANLENMGNTERRITNDKLLGGRIGLWWPEAGLEAGVSGLVNGDYVAGGFEDSLSLWAVDLNYHKGDWDVRAEYGETFQQAATFIGNNIRRKGFYTQVAYRPLHACNRYLRNVELVYRYGYVDFRGIDPTALDLTTFATPIDVPVRRQQNEFGVNYYFYPRMLLKFAYQINDEPGFHLHDNQFISELAWGW